MLKDNYTVIIPTKNERENLDALFYYLMPYVSELIVIDAHSNDGTIEYAKQYTDYVYQDKMLGKGQALRQAIQLASKPIIVFIDADHSHDPSDISKLVVPIIAGDADHVTGSRMLGGSDELHGDINKTLRMTGSAIITLGINYRFGVKLTDSQNGFRAIRTDVVKNINLQENITTIEQEMIIKTLLNHYSIGEVPTHEYSRSFGESKILVRKVAFRYIYSLIKLLCMTNCVKSNESLERDKRWEETRVKIYNSNEDEINQIIHILEDETLDLESKYKNR